MMKEEDINMNNTSNQTIILKEKSFCITGEFLTLQKGSQKPLTRNMVSKMIEAKSGSIKKTVIKSLDYLVIGEGGSDRYTKDTKGKKYAKAEEQQNTTIISETELLRALEH